jgi:hypothetical protein
VEHVALLGHPVAHSLSPRMQNAAFAARGLDWRYDAFDVEDVAAAVRALVTLGFAGANVTIPHKQAVVRACDEAEGDAVNTLLFRDGRVIGRNTDKEILAGIDARRACVIGAGGAAVALAPALPPDTRTYTRGGPRLWRRRHGAGRRRARRRLCGGRRTRGAGTPGRCELPPLDRTGAAARRDARRRQDLAQA